MSPEKRKRTFVIFLVVFSLLPLLPVPFFLFYGGMLLIAFAFSSEGEGSFGLFFAVLIGMFVVHYIKLIRKCYLFYNNNSVLIGEQTFTESLVLFSRSVFDSPKKAITVVLLLVFIFLIFLGIWSMIQT